MRIVKLSSSQFDRFTTTHRYRNFYQTSMYANVMRKFGYDSQYLGITDDNNVLIGASLIIYKEVFMKNKIAYAPRGILYNYENQEDVKLLAHTLKKSLGNEGFMLLRIDPYIPLTIRDSEGAIMNFNNKGNQIIENLKYAVATINKAKPASVKGVFISNITVTSTMGPGIKVDKNSFDI